MEEIEDNIANIPVYVPNDRYDVNHTLIATFNSESDVNQFCSTYTHLNGYNGLKLGQRIKINDGAYNKTWYIAGFDYEANNKAADGKVKSNGYGIHLVPESNLTTYSWSPSDSIGVGYIYSDIHNFCNTRVAPALQSILGSHLINRNVLLSSSISSIDESGASAYKWTTAYCTLMSVCQITGSFGNHCTKYDDGEANYKLPLYNFISYYYTNDNYNYWLRNTWGSYGPDQGSSAGRYCAYRTYTGNYYDTGKGYYVVNTTTNGSFGVRPMIYIR